MYEYDTDITKEQGESIEWWLGVGVLVGRAVFFVIMGIGVIALAVEWQMGWFK